MTIKPTTTVTTEKSPEEITGGELEPNNDVEQPPPENNEPRSWRRDDEGEETGCQGCCRCPHGRLGALAIFLTTAAWFLSAFAVGDCTFLKVDMSDVWLIDRDMGILRYRDADYSTGESECVLWREGNDKGLVYDGVWMTVRVFTGIAAWIGLFIMIFMCSAGCMAHRTALFRVWALICLAPIVLLYGLSFVVFGSSICNARDCEMSRSSFLMIVALMLWFLVAWLLPCIPPCRTSQEPIVTGDRDHRVRKHRGWMMGVSFAVLVVICLVNGLVIALFENKADEKTPSYPPNPTPINPTEPPPGWCVGAYDVSPDRMCSESYANASCSFMYNPEPASNCGLYCARQGGACLEAFVANSHCRAGNQVPCDNEEYSNLICSCTSEPWIRRPSMPFAGYPCHSNSPDMSGDGRIVVSKYRSDRSSSHCDLIVVWQHDTDNPDNVSWKIQGNVIDLHHMETGDTALSGDGTVLAVAIHEQREDGNTATSSRILAWKYSDTRSAWMPQGGAIEGKFVNDYYGSYLSLNSDGTILAASARYGYRYPIHHGYTQVFALLEDEWQEMGQVIADEGNTNHPPPVLSLSDDGLTLAIGTPSLNGEELGGFVKVWTYCAEPSRWVQIGDEIRGEGEWFGRTVVLSGNSQVVAVSRLGGGGGGGGGRNQQDAAVKVLRLVDGSWNQMGQELNCGQGADICGETLAVNHDGQVIAVGDQQHGANGLVRLFWYDDSTEHWQQRGQDLHGEDDPPNAGYSSYSVGYKILLSDDANTVASLDDTGSVPVWDFRGGAWVADGFVNDEDYDVCVDPPTDPPLDPETECRVKYDTHSVCQLRPQSCIFSAQVDGLATSCAAYCQRFGGNCLTHYWHPDIMCELQFMEQMSCDTIRGNYLTCECEMTYRMVVTTSPPSTSPPTSPPRETRPPLPGTFPPSRW